MRFCSISICQIALVICLIGCTTTYPLRPRIAPDDRVSEPVIGLGDLQSFPESDDPEAPYTHSALVQMYQNEWAHKKEIIRSRLAQTMQTRVEIVSTPDRLIQAFEQIHPDNEHGWWPRQITRTNRTLIRNIMERHNLDYLAVPHMRVSSHSGDVNISHLPGKYCPDQKWSTVSFYITVYDRNGTLVLESISDLNRFRGNVELHRMEAITISQSGICGMKPVEDLELFSATSNFWFKLKILVI